VVLGEMAHIVAERPGGPRGNSPMPLEKRNRAEHLILLCNNHHQLIDSQPQTYTFEKLRAMKETHERWVERSLGAGRDNGHVAQPPRDTEVVHSTLLPVERMPANIYGAPCDLDERDVQPLGPLRNGEMAPTSCAARCSTRSRTWPSAATRSSRPWPGSPWTDSACTSGGPIPTDRDGSSSC
jgi:hypothetical protein